MKCTCSYMCIHLHVSQKSDSDCKTYLPLFCLSKELGFSSDNDVQHRLSGNEDGYIDWWKCGLEYIFNNAESSRNCHERVSCVGWEKWWYITADEKIVLIILQCNIIFGAFCISIFIFEKSKRLLLVKESQFAIFKHICKQV